MGENTAISWTEKTWNPVVGCSLVTPGCTNCYAMKMTARLAAMGAAKYEGLVDIVKGSPVWNGTVRFAGPRALNEVSRWKKPSVIFVNSMSDLFHESLDEEITLAVLDKMLEVDRHIYQTLTKRPAIMTERIARWLDRNKLDRLPDHIWAGTSVEDQRRADERLPILATVPGRVRFVSMEPLLGPVDLAGLPLVEWYIVGGESVETDRQRSEARVFDPAWAEAVLDAVEGKAAFHMKQLGSNPASGFTRHRKGADMAEWPERLKIQEMPLLAA